MLCFPQPESGVLYGTSYDVSYGCMQIKIEEGCAEGTQHEYGAGPAELQALQGMAAKWWQARDVQHIHAPQGSPA